MSLQKVFTGFCGLPSPVVNVRSIAREITGDSDQMIDLYNRIMFEISQFRSIECTTSGCILSTFKDETGSMIVVCQPIGGDQFRVKVVFTEK